MTNRSLGTRKTACLCLSRRNCDGKAVMLFECADCGVAGARRGDLCGRAAATGGEAHRAWPQVTGEEAGAGTPASNTR